MAHAKLIPLPRPAILLLAALPVILPACASLDTRDTSIWDWIVAMLLFFVWFAFIWMFIAIFGDIFRRDDIGGGMKAIWVLVLIFLPFLGALIYLIARPKVTAADIRQMTEVEAAASAVSQVTVADELEKLGRLRESGAISQTEYETLKAQTIG